MAMSDYGAIAFKNGKCIQSDVFGDMKGMVGWEDTKNDTYRYVNINLYNEFIDEELPLDLKGQYFSYIGDDELTIVFYKTYFDVITKKHGKFCKKFISVESSNYTKWKKWEDCGYINNTYDDRNWYEIKVKPHHGYYILTMKYKGDKYKVCFGYGVDYDYYKKWHIVNYYKYSLTFRFSHTKFRIECWFDDKHRELKRR